MRLYKAFLVLISALCAQDLESLRQAAAAHPNDVKAHLDLGTTFMRSWIPGSPSATNTAAANAAQIEFRRVLELDPNNITALESLASMSYNEAMPLPAAEKPRKLHEAMAWYQRLATANPTSKLAYYSMGVIAWSKSYPALMLTRADLHMKPEDPGPLAGPARLNLKAQYSFAIDEGISNLERALQLDPNYSDAMAYMNLLIRERADLRDNKDEYAADVALADQWVQKALDVRKNHPQSNPGPPPPSPPPPSGSTICSGIPTPSRIRVGGNVQQANLVRKVAPIYPPLARQAHVEGIVRFTVTIAKDGSLMNEQLVSGHPLLVAAAVEALRQWVYKPTMLNGCPVEVITQVDIDFALAQMNN